MMHDPDLEAVRGPGDILIFLDGEQYCAVGSEWSAPTKAIAMLLVRQEKKLSLIMV